MDSELLEKEYNELQYSLDVETAEKFRKFVEGFRANLKALSGYAEIDVDEWGESNLLKFINIS